MKIPIKYNKYVSFIIVALAVVSILLTYANAATGEAEVCWFTTSTRNSGGSVSIQFYLDLMGYNAHRYQNDTASGVRVDMRYDKVFAVIGDGFAGYTGRVFAYNNATTMSGKSVSSDSNNYSLQAYANSYGSNVLSGMKFAYYGVGYSAATDSVYGNVVSKTAELGAKCSAGYTLAINPSKTTMFEAKMFSSLSQGSTIITAYYDGWSYLNGLYPGNTEIASFQTYGDAAQTIN